jgi:hypothetical protein
MNNKQTTTRPKAPPKVETVDDLRKVRRLTQKMRTAERRLAETGRERRFLLRNLRDRHVPFRALAEAAGTTEQAIYKDLRFGNMGERKPAIPSTPSDSSIG